MPYGELPEIETTTGEKTRGFPVVIINPAKSAVLRLPTNPELDAYLSKQKTLTKNLGRRMSEDKDVPDGAAAQRLFRAIRIGKGEDFDDAEASYAIGLLLQHRTLSCDREGDRFEVRLQTLFGEVSHSLEVPWQADLAEYWRNVAVPRNLPNNYTETRYPPEVPNKLFDKIVKSSDGYTPDCPVPSNHKRTVISEILSALSMLDPSLPTDADPN